MKLIILADIHYSDQSATSERRIDIADILLLRTVHRINRFLLPDFVIILGDIINEPQSPSAIEQYKRIKSILDILDAPYIIIPGNHDRPDEEFYKIFPKPDDIIEIANTKFVSLIDPEQPGYNAIRTERNLELMKSARKNFDGNVITLQHVPIFPPGTIDCPYNYTNANEIIEIMQRYKINLAISGHFHTGFDLFCSGDSAFLACPAICEAPFRFLEIDITENNNSNSNPNQIFNITEHQLAMPKELNLIDYHIHTHFAYCNENMNIEKAKTLAQAFNLAEIRFSEHSSHLYWNLQDYTNGIFYREGIKSAKPSDCRAEQYFSLLQNANCPKKCIGFEVDADWTGSPIIREQDKQRTGFLIGAIHSLPTYEPDKIKETFLAINERFLKHKFDILAHPFRIFRRSNNPIPSELFAPLTKLLKEHNTAAEINFHTNVPPMEFIKMCINADVKISFGSDSHNLYEIGEFYPHLKLLNECGIDTSDLKYIMLTIHD